MGWGKIKKAINSTLGTSDFQPLDKLIINSVYLTANDDVLYAVGDVYSIDGELTLFEKKVNISGVIRFVAEKIDSTYLSLLLYINGTRRTTISTAGYADVTITKGDVIKITAFSHHSGQQAYGVKLCGTVIQAPFGGEIFNNA